MLTEPRDLFAEALALFRSGEDREAYEAARALLEVAPDHVGGVMLSLATAGGCGDEVAIELGLLALIGQLERLLAFPEVVALLDSDLMAPVLSTRTFRESVAPALGRARRQARESSERETARQVLEAVRDASVERALFSAPVFRLSPDRALGALQLLDGATGEVVAVLRSERLYVGGRASVADIRLDHPSVSRLHFNIQRIETAWAIQNCSRTNGTKLNDRSIGEGWTLLQDGDSLQVGEVTLDVAVAPHHAEGEPAAAALMVPELLPEETTSSLLHAPPPSPEVEAADLLQTAPNRVIGPSPS